MDTTRWGQVLAAYQAVADFEPDDRAERLREACGGDADLEREVLSLLDFDSRAGGFLESTGVVRMLDLSQATDEKELFGRTLGGFTIQGILGRGGMSVVYDAEQANPRRRVALKVLRSGPLTDDVALRLFRREATALARLDHPGIAVIHGAGTQKHHHYLAMEFVDGRPITAFVRDHNLSIPQRLRLFRKVCDAVHYAHQRGIVHRDLKPSNILVPASGDPKVLDFGIARLLDAETGVTAHVTQPGVILGTLAYMSPEQARGDIRNIDTRSDVYALGIILYELLTGQLPLEVSRVSIPEAARAVCEQTPRNPGSLSRELRGDLDTIIMKAIEKRPEQRYESVAAVSDDLKRYLEQQPILARPPSTIYALRKLAARNRPLAIAVCVAFLAALGGIVATTRFALREQRARRELEQEFARNRKSQTYLLGCLDFSELAEKIDARVLIPILDQAYKRIDDVFADDPEVRVTLQRALGNQHQSLGNMGRAEEILAHAVEEARQIFGEDHVEYAQTLRSYARILGLARKYEMAAEVAREVVDACGRMDSPPKSLLASALWELGEALQQIGDADGGLEALERAGQLAADGEPGSRWPGFELGAVGAALYREGRYSEAAQVLERFCTEPFPGSTSPHGRWYLAFVYEYLGDVAGCLEQTRRYSDVIFGRNPVNLRMTTVARYGRSRALLLSGDYGDAEDLIRRASTDANAEGYADREYIDWFFAETLVQQGKYREAIDVCDRSIALFESDAERNPIYAAFALVNKAASLRALGDPADREPMLRRALQLFVSKFPRNHFRATFVLEGLAEELLFKGKLDEAEALAEEALATAVAATHPGSPMAGRLTRLLGEVDLSRGDLAAARGRFVEARKIQTDLFGDNHPEIARTLRVLASVEEQKGNLGGALALLRSANNICKARLRASHPEAIEIRNRIATLASSVASQQRPG